MTWRFGEEYAPFHKRRKEKPDQRINNELTEKARTKLAYTLGDAASIGDIRRSYRQYKADTGEGLRFNEKSKPSFVSFIEASQTDQEIALSFIEILLNTLWLESDLSVDELTNLDRSIREILAEEQLLLKLRPPREMIPEVKKESDGLELIEGQYNPTDYEAYQFEKLSNATVIEADQEVRALAGEELWDDVLEAYNEAWEIYKQGPPYTAKIPEKLYNSVELLVQKICIDIEGWENEGTTVGSCLDRLKDEGLFNPNKSMVGEWEKIMKGLRIGIQKTGQRKNWHNNIDQDYCLLLLHQTAAFLSFVIKRYEDKVTK